MERKATEQRKRGPTGRWALNVLLQQRRVELPSLAVMPVIVTSIDELLELSTILPRWDVQHDVPEAHGDAAPRAVNHAQHLQYILDFAGSEESRGAEGQLSQRVEAQRRVKAPVAEVLKLRTVAFHAYLQLDPISVVGGDPAVGAPAHA
ncbi:hypothetical protein B0H13DRAFT_1906766 [Mycena leptocephala]|nr:hypothetical protein B0H13DRAFT_1906766 [Mycena leptocephala]